MNKERERIGVKHDITSLVVSTFVEMNKLAKEYFETKGRVVALNSLGIISAMLQ